MLDKLTFDQHKFSRVSISSFLNFVQEMYVSVKTKLNSKLQLLRKHNLSSLITYFSQGIGATSDAIASKNGSRRWLHLSRFTRFWEDQIVIDLQ